MKRFHRTCHFLIFCLLLSGFLAPQVSGETNGAETSAAPRRKEAQHLVQEAQALDEAGKTGEAARLYDQALLLHARALGKGDPKTLSIARLAADAYHRSSLFLEAEGIYRAVIEQQEKELGPGHPDLIPDLVNLAFLYADFHRYQGAKTAWQGDHIPKAEALFLRALGILEAAHGENDPRLCPRLMDLGWLYELGNMPDKAETVYGRALRIRTRHQGAAHPDVAAVLMELGRFHNRFTAYDKAEEPLKQAVDILEKQESTDSLRLGDALYHLAMLHMNRGEFDPAAAALERVVRLDETAPDREEIDRAAGLDLLGRLRHRMGDYEKALHNYQEALAIREKQLHLDQIQSLNHLGELHMDLGAPQKALDRFRRALATAEDAYGSGHTETARCRYLAAQAYEALGKYPAALRQFRDALAVYEAGFDPESPETAEVLFAFGRYLHHRHSNYGAAEEYYRRAVDAWKASKGADHPDVALGLTHLARLQLSFERYDEAGALLAEALAIREAAFGPDHPLTAESHYQQGIYRVARHKVEAATGKSIKDPADYPAALRSFRRAVASDERMIRHVMGFTSERQKLRFLSERRERLDLIVSFAARFMPGDPEAFALAADVWLRRKGIVLEAQRRYQEALLLSGDPEAMAVFEALGEARTQLSRLAFLAPEEEDPAAFRAKMRDLEERIGTLEARLAAVSRRWADRERVRGADLTAVAGALPPGAVLLEYARIRPFSFSAIDREGGGGIREEHWWRPPVYMAFVIPSGSPAGTRLIDLGPAEAIDAAVRRLKGAITGEKGDPAEVEDRAAALHRLVFAPVAEALGDAGTIFISPDGNLNLVPFEVLKGPDGFLIRSRTFVYLAAGRDLLEFGASGATGGRAVLMGDPDFSGGTADPEGSGRRGTTVARSRDGLWFTPLPGTRSEVEAIAGLMEKTAYILHTGPAASEAVLAEVKSPALLHLATHGFFLDSPSGPITGRSIRGLSLAPKPPVSPEPDTSEAASGPAVSSENPLIRCGVALAGANETLVTGESDKGIMTAEKILAMDLTGTRMVVLSACETGLGQVRSGEGVYGLRRAFAQAGADSLVMSLWSVPDRETAELMAAFYANILKKGMDRATALRRAALSEMEIVRERYGHAHPLFWAAFIFMGEP